MQSNSCVGIPYSPTYLLPFPILFANSALQMNTGSGIHPSDEAIIILYLFLIADIFFAQIIILISLFGKFAEDNLSEPETVLNSWNNWNIEIIPKLLVKK